jgi:hypothetical protein
MKDKIIQKYLTNQNYNQLEIDNKIYFVKNVGDKYAEIRFDKSDGWCYISYELISFFSRMMGIEESDIKEVIGRWVEHTLQMKVKYTRFLFYFHPSVLNIPYNKIN